MLNPSDLRRVDVLNLLPDSQLQWMLEQGQEIRLAPGELLRGEGTPASSVFVIVEGSLTLTQRSGNQEILLKQHDSPALFGEVPLLMGVPNFWATARAVTRCQILALSAEDFWQLMAFCPVLSTAILQTMVGRMQEAQMLAQHRERLISLGTLAAGLAHELNNPAAAASRTARELRAVFPLLQTQTLKLTQRALSDQQRAFLTTLQQEAIESANQVRLDPLIRSDREDQIIEWMDEHEIDQGWKFASTLVNAGLELNWLDQIANQINGQCLTEILCWLDLTLTVVGLLKTLDYSTKRIDQLVEAVQNYSSIESETLQTVDLHEGLENTLTLLVHKINKGITVIRDYGEHLPPVRSHGSELEQVWLNILDNAIDATLARFEAAKMPQSVALHTRPLMVPMGWQENNSTVRDDQQPTIWIKTRSEGGHILVEIADNGTGISAEIQPHIFQPFFTTKGVGQGTGLGLSTSYKIIERHRGVIRVVSQPGDTCFQVRIPV